MTGSYLGNSPAKEYDGSEKANDNPAVIGLFNDFQKSNPQVKGVKVINHIIGTEKVDPFYVIYDAKSFYGQGSLTAKIEEETNIELAALSEPQPTVEIPIVEPQPTLPTNLTSGSGIEFDLGDLSDLDLSITTTEELNVKPGVQELFDSNPELSKIGDVFSYASYLNTIFPDSKVKDIVYHGSKIKIDTYKKGLDGGIHFGSLEAAKEIKGGLENIQGVLLNIDKVKETEDAGSPDKWNSEILTAKRNNENGIYYRNVIEDIGSDSYIVFEPEQIHILGNKQDIDGFKEFTKSRKQIEKSVSLQDKVNTLIQEGKATKFCK
jgi:hypothetical protein